MTGESRSESKNDLRCNRSPRNCRRGWTSVRNSYRKGYVYIYMYIRGGRREYTSIGWKSWWWVEGEEEKQGRRVQVHIGEGVPEQCAHSMRSRYDYRKPSRNYFLYIENARGPSSPSFLQKLPPLFLSPLLSLFLVSITLAARLGSRNDLFLPSRSCF